MSKSGSGSSMSPGGASPIVPSSFITDFFPASKSAGLI